MTKVRTLSTLWLMHNAPIRQLDIEPKKRRRIINTIITCVPVIITKLENKNMNGNVIIFKPNSLETCKSGYLIGCYKEFKDCEAYYITNDTILNNCSQCIGYVGKSLKYSKLSANKTLFINSSSGKIALNNTKDQSLLEIVYDYESFKNSEIVHGESQSYGKHFKILTEELRKNRLGNSKNGRKTMVKYSVLLTIYVIDLILKINNVFKPLLRYSATFLHFEESIINLKWFLNNLVEEKKLTPKTGNALVAKTIDLLIGIILLNWFLKYETNIFNIIQTSIEDIIANLKGLLLYLMGSPIGLKLNYSFNKILGKFFFYHISLWRVFLRGMEPLLTSSLKFLVLQGTLGFSLQVAMFSDIISIATFHVYCIYVYAARLFFLQMTSLISLWRLFIGRKFNPLRRRVDSCQYSQNQLFIGTLGFTILLFLLPTTAMYYTVFTTFRLLMLLIEGILLRLRYLLNTLPLYTIMLWIFNSSSIAGTVYLKWKDRGQHENVRIEAKLNALPLSSSIKKFIPDPIQPIKRNSIGYTFHCMFNGILI